MIIDPPQLISTITELRSKPLTQNQFEAIQKVVAVSSHLERTDLIPVDELNIRWRIEVSAAFLTALIAQTRQAALDDDQDPDALISFMLELAERRAREIHQQAHAE